MQTPIACTLTSAGLATQSERWRALPLVLREETADGLRLTFRDSSGVRAKLAALAAVERGCCAWATWEVDGAVLTVCSTGDGVAVLHGMFAAR